MNLLLNISEKLTRVLVKKLVSLHVKVYIHIIMLTTLKSKRLSKTQLPPKEAFYNKLNNEHISDEDYKHMQKVWEAFDCKTLKDYHDIYLMSDILLLTDVFETFRDICMTNYELDPAWYYTAPCLAWDAALKKTKVELELLTDTDMLLRN